jgi:hypothetical protein
MPTKIIVKTNGSIRVEGDFELVDVNGNKFDLNGRTAVCFFGLGQKKDNTICHRLQQNHNADMTFR